MKNLTITLDDETYRQARIRAAEMGTSISAMVKRYLTDADTGAGPERANGVREMPTSWTAQTLAAQAADDPLPPGAYGRFPDGTPYYTPDGKPRKPGAMRHLYSAGLDDDFDSWPDGFIDAIYGEDTEAANNWWKPFANPPTAKP